MSTYTELVEQLKAANESWESIGPQPESRILEVEQKYGIRLPNSFRSFLIEVGGVEFLDHHFTSIDDDYLDDQDGFMCNTHMLKEQCGMPVGLIALEYDHDADQIACLDLEQMKDGECPVVWLHAFQGKVVGKCADSFEAYFQSIVTEWTV